MALAGEHDPEPGTLTRAPITPGYTQIIAVFTGGAGRLRAREICQALDIGTDPRHTEGMRSKLVARGILSEPEAGLFALAAKPSVQRESP